MASRFRLPLAALVVAAACSHGKELTGDDHREAAQRDAAAAERSRERFDPDREAMVIQPRVIPFRDDATPPPYFYNPTEANLMEADRRMASAFKHLDAARRLEKFEDVACTGLSDAERMSCPLIAPHVAKVEELRRGVVLHVRSAEKAKTLAIQMRCHLAFARANNFDRVPCPLYVKGVAINLVGPQEIEVAASDANVARVVRQEARRMFGEVPDEVSCR